MASRQDELLRLQERLGHRFADAALLQRALTHKSFSADHYERLEFLGDAVLELGISALLFERLDKGSEGDLTRVRAMLVRQDTLHRLALDLGLPSLLRLSEAEAKGGGHLRASILADALEAILGGIQLDAGFEAAQQTVRRLFEPVLADPALVSSSKDAKTALQELLQGRKLPVPVYSIAATLGKAHEQTFVITCALPHLNICVQGEGLSRRAAEQVAAQAALDLIEPQPQSSLGPQASVSASPPIAKAAKAGKDSSSAQGPQARQSRATRK